MKKSAILFAALIFFNGEFCSAQSFTLLANDNQGDNTQTFAKDIKSLSYAMDMAQDSIWIKIEFYEDISGDFGCAIGIDTNLMVTDGTSWNGSNTSMKYDYVIYLERNGLFEQYISSFSTLVKNVAEPDPVTLIVNLQLSEMDDDGTFNLIAGTGSFVISTACATYDDIPDNGYVTIPTVMSITEPGNQIEWSVFPNPNTGEFTFEMQVKEAQEMTLKIVNILGQEVFIEKQQLLSGNYRKQIDIQKYPRGLYLLQASTARGSLTKRIILE